MTEDWYYADNGQQLGPVSTFALRDMLANGTVKPGDLVWRDGMSNWVPASESRELCPTPPIAAVAAPAPRPAAEAQPAPAQRRYDEAPPARAQRRYDELPPRDRWDERRPIRRQPPPPGMSTTAKVLIFGGIAAFLLIGLMIFIGIVVVAANTTQRNAARYSKTQPVAQGGRGVAAGPLIGPGVNNMAPIQPSVWNVNLNFEGQKQERTVSWVANQTVRVTVTTTEWGGGPEPDVDVYVYDQMGNLVFCDNQTFKDCDMIFLVPATGNYRIVVHLCMGNRARCVVRY
jgi:hypothetical protein